MIPLGKVEKMTIRAYSDPESNEELNRYDFLINPETYNFHHEMVQVPDAKGGTSGSELKYNGQLPNIWEFDILIDGTGVIRDASALNFALIGNVKEVDVEAQVKKLKSVVLDYNGEIHRNQYLKISWGNRDVFKGTLVSLDLNYKLFRNDGSPLRVIAKLKLTEWIDRKQSALIEASSSPDITHERIYKAHDRIDLLCHRIYKDPGYYIDIAAVNNLDSFRKISAGNVIKFPPVK